MSAYEMAVESWLGESETGEEFRKRLRKLRNFRRAVILQIFSTITQPLPNDAIPPPPVVVVQPERKDRGGQGGSREDEFATMPGAAVLQRVGRLAATVPREADAEAYAGALPMLAATLVPGAAPAIIGAAPVMVGGMSSAARILRKNPATRDLVRSLPTSRPPHRATRQPSGRQRPSRHAQSLCTHPRRHRRGSTERSGARSRQKRQVAGCRHRPQHPRRIGR